MPQPESLAGLLESDPMFANDVEGNPIHRRRSCECGVFFTQRLLSERFLTIVDRGRGIQGMIRQVPEFYVPVHCPKCERRDLGMQARRDEFKHLPQPFGEAAD